ncbi:MAG TPA: cytochrome c [Kofleriaceae bacterium]|nr:cytochrome c [Kofleriaceae bacterium]
MLRASLVIVAVLAACGRQHRGEPTAPELRPRTAEVSAGQKLFRKFCYQCHPGGSAGIGPALNNKPLPEFAIRTQIRKGVGAMPAFPDDWLDDSEVAAIAEYVQALRASPKSR